MQPTATLLSEIVGKPLHHGYKEEDKKYQKMSPKEAKQNLKHAVSVKD